MINDSNPSLFGITYCSPKINAKFEKALIDNGFRFREIKFYDITIDLNKYNEQINFLKHFIRTDYWGVRNPLFTKNYIMKGILGQIKKKGFSQIKFTPESWETDISNPLIYSLFCPLFYQNNINNPTTKKEIKALKDLETFKSKNYEADKSAISKNQEDTKTFPKKWVDDYVCGCDGCKKGDKCLIEIARWKKKYGK